MSGPEVRFVTAPDAVMTPGQVRDLQEALSLAGARFRCVVLPHGSPPWPDLGWLEHLDASDRSSFFADLRRSAGAAEAAGDAAEIVKCLREWRVTAEALADPLRREVLTGVPDPGDFTEVARPEGAS